MPKEYSKTFQAPIDMSLKNASWQDRWGKKIGDFVTFFSGGKSRKGKITGFGNGVVYIKSESGEEFAVSGSEVMRNSPDEFRFELKDIGAKIAAKIIRKRDNKIVLEKTDTWSTASAESWARSRMSDLKWALVNADDFKIGDRVRFKYRHVSGNASEGTGRVSEIRDGGLAIIVTPDKQVGSYPSDLACLRKDVQKI